MSKKLLMLSSMQSTFIRQDEEILKAHFHTRAFHLEPPTSRWHSIKNYFKLIFWLARNIRSADGLFVVFPDFHAFLMALFALAFNKSLFVVVGGFDAVWIPEIGYGTYHKKRSRFFTHFTLQNTTRILPVCQSLKIFGEEMQGPFRITQGVLTLYPDIPESKVTVVPNGYKTEYFTPAAKPKDPTSILLVASVRNPVTYKIKGIDLFIQLAEHCPQWSFCLVGMAPNPPFGGKAIPANMRAIPFLAHDDLLQEYQRAKVVLSLSITEGMPNVISEGMLCECVPVGFPVGAIPEIIGDTGVVLNHRGLDEIQSGLEQALTMDGNNARQRILDHFPFQARSQALYKIIEQDIGNPA